MIVLFLVSLAWAFSFGLIKGRLGSLDPTAVGVVRMAIALGVFLPFLKIRSIRPAQAMRLAAIGALEFGVMYVLYLQSYAHLQSWQVALFTITTPLFVSLVGGVAEGKWKLRHLAAALLAVAGAGIAVFGGGPFGDVAAGFVLVQASNLCFATGQIAWRHERARLPAGATDAQLFALPYAGALAATLAWSAVTVHWGAFHPTAAQRWVLAYLGLIPSGVAFFGWNYGSENVTVGTLAVFNNLKIPLGIACSLLVFGESADIGRLVASCALLASALWISESIAPPFRRR